MWNKDYIEEFIRRFEAGQLPKEEWTHEAHLVVGIVYVTRYEFDRALALARENITAHNVAVGTINSDSSGYHESITRFWLEIIKRYLKARQYHSIEETVHLFLRSSAADKDLPMEFYSRERLFTTEARTNWVDPDKKAFEE
ncbi:MAG: hypothetical protein A3D92_08980 [Bacteroidetes bacterium RIFCSPHIGHO2_02_FULL_44_7]|nr:MAG: hypothetical protein A3D92_08980 [Bacteroidetes bacterium RIFCSPHIGHO2_02_FULL_44_7]